MKKRVLNILIGGPAGSGIESAGALLGQALNRDGASVVVANEIMSLIRGGHNYNRVRFSYAEEVLCHDETVDVVVALDKLSVTEHLNELSEGGIVVYDSACCDVSDLEAGTGVEFLGADLSGTAKELGGEIYKNTVALGVVLALTGVRVELLEKALKEKFATKGAEVVEANVKALNAGAGFVSKARFEFEGGKGFSGEMLLNGNDAFCVGAVAGGCKFVAAYPMTPASSIMHTMVAWSEKFGIVMKHAEDELAAINMVIGAGFAGARALTATSGGGFALMTEMIGLAGCAEVPCVVVNSQRVGPSTGLPTRTEQGDLRQVMHASQGDFPRLIMAPGDAEECFEMGFESFNYAEKYQIPVMVLLDKYLSESTVSREAFGAEAGAGAGAAGKIERGKILDSAGASAASDGGFFKRYADSEDGVSGRTLPGTSDGCHVATSYETDEFGDLEEDRESRILLMDKRMRKMDSLLAELPAPELMGASEAEAEITFISWGSMKPVLEEVLEKMEAGVGGSPVKANILMIKYMVPFHADRVLEILSAAVDAGSKIVLVEQNFGGQLGGLITEKTGFRFGGGPSGAGAMGGPGAKILKYDGRQMDSNFIINALAKL